MVSALDLQEEVFLNSATLIKEIRRPLEYLYMVQYDLGSISDTLRITAT